MMKNTLLFVHQFGCGISKMVDPKKQDFCLRINMLEGKKKNPANE
jgi:hypothetical protein